MADHVPPWFDEQQAPDESERDFKRRKAALLEELPQLLARQRDRGRADQFLPYLLVRSVLGDRGDRPVNAPFWESPDIWTAPGDPAASPATPPDHGGQVAAGQATTLYAHVWNLGFAPLAGVKVEFYWFDPSISIDGTHAHLIGVARCELAGRGMQGSHKLVKCPAAWVPTVVNGGHECLVVRASGIGDPLGGNEWKPWLNRHVAQRNISVVSAGANVAHLIASLNATRALEGMVQLVQVGPREAGLAGKIAAPRLRIAELQTHVLGEIDLAGRVVRGSARISAAMLSPVHALAVGGAPPPPTLQPRDTVRAIDPDKLFGGIRLARDQLEGVSERVRIVERAGGDRGHLRDLLARAARLHRGEAMDLPRRGEAQVVRVAQYQGEQLVGGYTMVVAAGRR